ncbi:molybdopterin-guanine dinucleotide biosynthesis protein B|uniref:Molybdopterin guanine dinucleotide biosynthesis accessory protein MobB n=1 Tax=Dendrosporobacter quercicolus TaxID=146817 RepID=A0A1H0AJR9_9FIRM|nr:molybdopterin-guanine dinucleotide biosynthesis protein B [Dendrosporobacter quercicolus]NSL50059.1 molybdopterin-guanine dinucleotide biosynthesis protein B [Dendrosporobacter quercicolus DSM 1736]SDN33046.1 molybdopterin guanine dinucleotide biosynthesis accessory protein MobB [Dendrosporobacter quercicolus]
MPPIVSFVGFSNSGKTAFLVKLIQQLKNSGYKVGVIKHHDGHDFTMDYPGTDTWKHREAGADTVCIASAAKIAVLKQAAPPVRLAELTPYFTDVDIILTEGFKNENQPQIEVNRAGLKPLGRKPNTLAVISADVLYNGIPHFAPEAVKEVAEFLEKRVFPGRS